jgi:membrane-bound metal-dependent hydrolase YbcI (DUF457 family)
VSKEVSAPPAEPEVMWPWGHAAFGYLLYRLGPSATGRRPTGPAVLALGVGTQFPDLVDKPLAWSLAVLPSGRSLAHSVLVAAVVIAAVAYVTRSSGRRRAGRAFAVGYLSHLLGDALVPLVELDAAFLTFLVWPLLPPPPYESDSGFAEHVASLSLTTTTAVGLLLTALALTVWAHDGYPGLATLDDAVRGRRVES